MCVYSFIHTHKITINQNVLPAMDLTVTFDCCIHGHWPVR